MDIFKTKSGERVITQKPNAPILVAALFWLVEQFSEGEIAEYASFVVAALLLVWGVLELVWGVNTWRRALGAAVIFFVLIPLFT